MVSVFSPVVMHAHAARQSLGHCPLLVSFFRLSKEGFCCLVGSASWALRRHDIRVPKIEGDSLGDMVE
jgi:hypothetical protein